MRALVLSLVSTLLSFAIASTPSGACNNSPELCALPYDTITHLGAHDSPFVRDATTDDSISGNQYYNSTVQLSAGVRLLTAQVHSSNGEWHLCHTSCDLLDAGLLSSWLEEILTWLDSNPNDVVTILLVNSDNATPDELAAQFSSSGITQYSYTPPSTTSPPAPGQWPTLQALITANTRLLSFVASLDLTQITSTNSYLMDEFTFIFENQFQVDSLSNFSCTPNRPSSVEGNVGAAIGSNRMPLMNHFLDESELFGIEVPDISNITITNGPGSDVGNLGYSLNSCKSAYGKTPTFTLVDFFDQGPAIAAVDNINGVSNPVGRTPVPSGSNGESSSQTAFEGVVELVKEVQMGMKPSLGAWIWAAGDWSWGGIDLSGGSLISK
jgi:hypothetical protein